MLGLSPMFTHIDSPLVVFLLALAAQILAVIAGDYIRKRRQVFRQDERHDFATVQAATLTLLALIIGFTFSMAVTRYDQRKSLEEAEANAIGTEYLRVELLPGDLSSPARDLLRKYLDLRIAFYEADDPAAADEIGRRTSNLQSELWSSVLPAASSPTPITALVIAGMNDVINAQGYAQAAWWNRIPRGAWTMMFLMAISCSLLVGYGEQRKGSIIVFFLPVVVSIAFFLISDLDNPRGGVIRVHPQNLQAVVQSMTPQ